MGWIFYLPGRAARLARHGHGGGSAHLIHRLPGVTPPPAHSTGTPGVIVLVLLAVIVAPFLWGLLTVARGRNRHSRFIPPPPRHGLPARSSLASLPARGAPRAKARGPQPDSYRTPVRVSSQQLKTAITLFKSACPSCQATVNEPCFPGPGEEAVVMVRERRWYCCPARVVLGCKENRGLYVALMAEWEGEVPKYMEGLHVD